jgi:DHA3 family multidrug efflux protein-like MFS transporter
MTEKDKKAMVTFYNLLANTVIASITNMTVWFAIIFYIYLKTRSVFATSMMSGIYLIAVAFTGFWFGSLVDHHKKKNMMLLSSFISLPIYVICFLIYTLAGEAAVTNISGPTMWIFIVLILMAVLAGNIRGIALPTIIKFLVPEDKRDKANGMAGTANGVVFLIVSVISGFLVGAAGMYWVLILAIIFTGLAIVNLWMQNVEEKRIVHLDADGQPQKIDIKGTIKIMRLVPGLLPLIFFTTFNNFLGGVFMSLMDAYGLSLVSVQIWGVIWGVLSAAFIVGGLIISKWGVGKNPVRSLFVANLIIWTISSLFTINGSIIPLMVGMFLYLSVMPFIEASEQTIIQKVVPKERLGRVFGFAQSVEQSASPITAFLIGPIAQFITIPFMTTGAGVELIGDWFGTGYPRGIALVFTIAGLLGLALTLFSMTTKYYRQLSEYYLKAKG